MNDADKLIKCLEETAVPHSVFEDGGYVHVTIEANASDKYVTITFKDGVFGYSN